MVALLQLSLFGPFSLQCDGRAIPIKSLKLRAMLGYIALNEAVSETRERLVGLLWSERSETQARAVLRQVVHELRESLSGRGASALRITPQEVGFERGAIEVDAWSVVRAAEAGDVHRLLLERTQLVDELLAGLDDLDPSFRTWVMARRQTLRDRLLRALERALGREPADPQMEVSVAQAIINLDPTHEEACRRLMRHHASSGHTALALRVYKSLWDLLDEDYGMEPAAATQQLVAEIKMGAYERDGEAPPPPAAERFGEVPGAARTAGPAPAIRTAAATTDGETRLSLSLHAVDVQQVDADKAHLVLGFRQLLLASLVKFREWHVTDVPFQAETSLQREPDARYEIRMFASQGQDKVLLTLMLKELQSGFYVWSDGFELNLDNWFDSQRRVIGRIAMALNVHLSAARLRRFSERPDIAQSVYDRWLRCQTLVRTFDPQHWRRLAGQFSEIVDAAPEFVPAYCGLADLHTIEHIAHPGVFRARDREQKALELARKAVELDAADIHAHRCLAWANAMIGKHTQAELHIQVACELNPNDSWTAISGALLLAFCGEFGRASELSRIALDMTLSPSRTHWAYKVDIEFLGGNYAAAVEAADFAQDVLWGVAAWRTSALAHLGRTADAAAEGARFLTRTRAHWFGIEPPTDEAIVRWLLHLYPIRHRSDWERLRDGLKVAGLPTGAAEHEALSSTGGTI